MKMQIKIENHEFENDVECKCIMDGYENFANAVEKYDLFPNHFSSADWGTSGSIIVTQ